MLKNSNFIWFFVFLLSGCSYQGEAADLPKLKDLGAYYAKYNDVLLSFADLIAAEESTYKLQYLDGTLMEKSKLTEWQPYEGIHQSEYLKLMRELGVRFAGKTSGKIYLDMYSIQNNEGIVLVELVSFLGEERNSDCIKSYMVERTGSCLQEINKGWFGQYNWVSF